MMNLKNVKFVGCCVYPTATECGNSVRFVSLNEIMLQKWLYCWYVLSFWRWRSLYPNFKHSLLWSCLSHQRLVHIHSGQRTHPLYPGQLARDQCFSEFLKYCYCIISLALKLLNWGILNWTVNVECFITPQTFSDTTAVYRNNDNNKVLTSLYTYRKII